MVLDAFFIRFPVFRFGSYELGKRDRIDLSRNLSFAEPFASSDVVEFIPIYSNKDQLFFSGDFFKELFIDCTALSVSELL